jgi:hypothetical protein
MLLVGGVLLAAVAYLLTKDITTLVIIIFSAVLLAVLGGRKPKVLSYALDEQGLTIGERTYAYTKFKSFSVIDEGAVSSISLNPNERFSLGVSVYYDPADEQRIVDTLAAYLPFEDREHAMIDRFMSRVRF